MIDSMRIYRIFAFEHDPRLERRWRNRTPIVPIKEAVRHRFRLPATGHRRGRHLTRVMSADLVSTNLFELLQA
jgi:hypothetical protein